MAALTICCALSMHCRMWNKKGEAMRIYIAGFDVFRKDAVEYGI